MSDRVKVYLIAVVAIVTAGLVLDKLRNQQRRII